MNADQLKSLLAKRLKERRQYHRWTAKEAAERATIVCKENMSVSRWQNWECGQRTPSIHLLEPLAKVLETTIFYLIGITDNPSVSTSDDGQYRVINASINSTQDDVAFSETALTQKGLKSSDMELVKVTDKSMSPVIDINDLVLVDKSKNRISGINVYALKTKEEDVIIRNVRRELTGDYTIYANKEDIAPTAKLSADEFNKNLYVLGKPVFRGNWLE